MLGGPSLKPLKNTNDGQTTSLDNTPTHVCETPTPSGTSLSPDQKISLRCWTLMRAGSNYWRTLLDAVCKEKDSFVAPADDASLEEEGGGASSNPRPNEAFWLPRPDHLPRGTLAEWSGLRPPGDNWRKSLCLRTWKTFGGRPCLSRRGPSLGRQKMAPRHPAPRTYGTALSACILNPVLRSPGTPSSRHQEGRRPVPGSDQVEEGMSRIFPSGQWMIGSAPAVRFLTGPVPLRPIPYRIRRP